MLAIMIEDREAKAAQRPEQPKAEVLLQDAGLDTATIARLLGKNPAAVRMALSRARAKQQETTSSRKAPRSGKGGNG
ncbi:MAG: sigma factor-like helix-turn-helix DNA-binding protein [Thermoleophilia bacterium]